MKNKIICIILAIVTMVAFTGCQLAHEDLAQAKINDRLIGVFVSYEYIDLFDIEGYLNDNIGKLANGSEIEIDGANSQYNNRLYATLVEEELTTTDGEKYTKYKYVFEGVDGISMFSPSITEPVTGDSYSSSSSDNGISDLKYNVKVGDNEKGIELEGTVYIASGMSMTLFTNPVYQSNDGKVYLLSGEGFSSENIDEGEFFTSTMDDSTSITDNKITTTYTASIKLSIATMNPTEKVGIYQMDSENNIITKNEYLPGKVPEEIVPDKSCEYFIVESHKRTFNGEKQVERQLFSKKDDSLYYLKKGDNSALYKILATILWETEDNI